LLAFSVNAIRPTALALFLLVFLVALAFAGRAVTDRSKAPVYLGGLTIFCIILGLGISPLPGSAAGSFSTRLAFILFAILYTVTFAALLWRPSHTRATSDS
jgi:hypothetical protein